MTDPIADMLTRVRNALAVQKTEVVLPYSKMKFRIAEILKAEKYLTNVEHIPAGAQGNQFDQLKLTLKYNSDKEPAMSHLKRISKPGLRIYAPKDALPVVLNNLGIAIISTSQGIMTNKQARKAGVGGEVICEIY